MPDHDSSGDSSGKTAVIFIGIPASGKSTFFHCYFEGVCEHINLDTLHTRKREHSAVESCIAEGKSFVVDNTNPTKEDRQRYFPAAKAAGYRVVAYFFQSKLSDCIARNAKRNGKGKVPEVALAAISSKLELPETKEGFDEIFFVRIEGSGFVTELWKED
ncbi:MAG: ATP-binding protein [Clostridiales bacterium]|nr:ATP-binding protein [Clostridiales bacterium]